jgi:autophagy-related protein 18
MSSLLAVSSDSSTIHIYKLHDLPTDDTESIISSPGLPPPGLPPSRTSSLGRRSFKLGKSLVGGVGGYLPRSVSEMWEPQRDFAFIKLRNPGRTVVAMSA